MAEDQDKPIALLITEDIESTLSQVRTEGGYHVTLIVERLNAENHEFNRPRHLLAVIDPGDPEPQDNASEGEDEFVRTYVIHVWVMPSQTDGRPLDEYFDFIHGDVVKALCSDVTNSFRRGGLAIETKAGALDTVGPLPSSLAYIVNVPVEVRYTTRTRNLYQQ
jgi:hypothetical protein